MTPEQLAALEAAETEAVRSRGFIRGAETQALKVEARLADLRAALESDPEPLPPDPEPDPEPSTGMVALLDGPHPAIDADGWVYDEQQGHAHVVHDAAYGDVLEIVYPEGYPDTGVQPCTLRIDAGGARVLDMTFDFQASPDWQPHNSGINKIWFLRSAANFNAKLMCVMRGLGPYSFDVDPQGHPQPAWLTPNLAPGRIVPGQWHRIRVRADHAAGTLDVWIDGVHVSSYTGLALDGDGFGTLGIEPTYGGTENALTGPKRHRDYYRFGEIRIEVSA